MNRRFWPVLFLAASLLPWRVAFACAHQPGLMQQQCCCVQMLAICPQIKTGTGKCCETVVAAATQLADSQSDTLPSTDGGKPLAPPPSAPAFIPKRWGAGRDASWIASGRNWAPGNETYLQTLRLRL